MGIALVVEDGALVENENPVGAAFEPPGGAPIPVLPVPNRPFAADELVGAPAPRENVSPNTNPAPVALAAVLPNNAGGDEAAFTPEDALACPGPRASTAVPPNNADVDEAVLSPEAAFARLGMNRRSHCERPLHTSSEMTNVHYYRYTINTCQL